MSPDAADPPSAPSSQRERPLGLRRRPLGSWLPSAAALIVIVAICAGVELTLLGADGGLWGTLRWRQLAYQNGGFWIGLLGNWMPNYPGQSIAMFVTYGFLHGGLGHMTFNMITLISVGSGILARVGQLRFVALYALSLLGGAVGFAVLSSSVQPMVGASGALFGLVGAWVTWDWRDRRSEALSVVPILWTVLGLGFLNLGMYWAMSGLLAWETHLGGFLAGSIAAPFLDQPRLAKTRS